MLRDSWGQSGSLNGIPVAEILPPLSGPLDPSAPAYVWQGKSNWRWWTFCAIYYTIYDPTWTPTSSLNLTISFVIFYFRQPTLFLFFIFLCAFRFEWCICGNNYTMNLQLTWICHGQRDNRPHQPSNFKAFNKPSGSVSLLKGVKTCIALVAAFSYKSRGITCWLRIRILLFLSL